MAPLGPHLEVHLTHCHFRSIREIHDLQSSHNSKPVSGMKQCLCDVSSLPLLQLCALLYMQICLHLLQVTGLTIMNCKDDQMSAAQVSAVTGEMGRYNCDETHHPDIVIIRNQFMLTSIDVRDCCVCSDVFNEKPAEDEIVPAGEDEGSALGATLPRGAIIHTTRGDIVLRLFPEECPKVRAACWSSCWTTGRAGACPTDRLKHDLLRLPQYADVADHTRCSLV